MNEPSPTAKMLLFAYLDERIEWGELVRWANDLGVPLTEIIDLQEARAPTRRAGVEAVCPSGTRSHQEMDAIAFAYANEWIAFDDIVRWGEDQEVEDDYLLLVGARDVCPDRSLGVMQCEPMRLWLLRPHTEVLARGRSPWRPWFEKVFGVVVRASSEEEARALAHSEAGSEGLGIYQGLGWPASRSPRRYGSTPSSPPATGSWRTDRRR